MVTISLEQARVPEDVRIYTVGDVHGRHDLLVKLFDQISADAAAAPEKKMELIFLGDYIDRGLYARQTLDWLIDLPTTPAGVKFRVTCLRGNHEAMLLDFLTHPENGQMWLEHGAYETLLSFGIKLSSPRPKAETFRHLAEQLQLKLQGKYLEFLSNRGLARTVGDYFFCHAGIEPGQPIKSQKAQNLLWIRDKFLLSEKRYEKIIVHGHSIASLPDVRPNRIGIDTGAYGTGRLTALVLYGNNRRFLST
jgi:serine/threonine protein phosphatase 1